MWSDLQRVRSAALRTLSIFPDAIRYEVLHPLKSKVVRGLAGVLDDKKRLVRKEAVDTRSKWLVYRVAFQRLTCEGSSWGVPHHSPCKHFCFIIS